MSSLTEAESVNSDDPEKWIANFGIGNLVNKVDVYCRTVDLESPNTFLWDGVCDCVGVCQHKTQTACGLLTDPRRGFFIPRVSKWNGTANVDTVPTHGFPPLSLKANYYAGGMLDSRSCRMNFNLERAIVKLTNVLLPEPPCGFCDQASRRWKQDRETHLI